MVLSNFDALKEVRNPLPAVVYEALPGVYFFAAIATLWLPGAMIKYASSLLLLGACTAVLSARHRFRKLQKMSLLQPIQESSVDVNGAVDLQSWPVATCRIEH